MLIAISCGSLPPIGSPSGQVILSNKSSANPDSRRSRSKAARFDALHLKLTSHLFHTLGGLDAQQRFARALDKHFGARRLLWGSDFPHTQGSAADPYKELVDLAREALAFLSPADREQLLAGTARSLFPALARA